MLFLNKCDELEQKLALGLRVEDFIQLSTKHEAGNDVESVKSCEYMLTLLPPRELALCHDPASSFPIIKAMRPAKRPDLTS